MSETTKQLTCALLTTAVIIAFFWTVFDSTSGSSNSSSKSKKGTGKQGVYSNGEDDSFVTFAEEYGWLLIIASACLCYCAIVPCMLAVCPCFSDQVNPMNGRIVEADVEIHSGKYTCRVIHTGLFH